MLPRRWPHPVKIFFNGFSCKELLRKKKEGGECAGRESNPGLVRGRDVYYHCTTGADVVVCQCALHSAGPNQSGHWRCRIRAQTGRGQEAMAQWQRVGFQTQRLGVRIPLASHPFFPKKNAFRLHILRVMMSIALNQSIIWTWKWGGEASVRFSISCR